VDHPEWVTEVFLPEVAIEPEGEDHYRLSWPALYKDARVEFTLIGGLGQPWIIAPNTPTETNGTLVIFRNQSGPETFFRLVLP
jgi:hypothetical protein